MIYRYRYTRLNLNTGERTTGYREFNDTSGGFAPSMIMFLNFLNDYNKTTPGLWQYWADDINPVWDNPT